MTVRPANPKVPPTPPGAPDVIEVSEQAANLIETMDEMQNQAEYVWLCEFEPTTGNTLMLEKIPVLDFSFEKVRDEYGGGSYAALFYKKGRICARSNFRVSPLFQGTRRAPPAPTTAADPGPSRIGLVDPAAAQLAGELAGMRMLVASQGSMVNALLAAVAGKSNGVVPAASGADPLDAGLKIAALVREAMGDRKQADPVSMAKELRESWREGLNLGKSIMNPEPAEEGFGSVISSLIPLAERAIDKIPLPAMSNVPALPSGPTLVRESNPLPPKKETPTVDLTKAPWLAHLHPVMGEIANAAKQGWEQETYIPFLVSRLPVSVIDEIELASRAPTFVDDALAALPAPFLMYKAWLTKALTILAEEVKPEPEETGDDDDGDGGTAG